MTDPAAVEREALRAIERLHELDHLKDRPDDR